MHIIMIRQLGENGTEVEAETETETETETSAAPEVDIEEVEVNNNLPKSSGPDEEVDKW